MHHYCRFRFQDDFDTLRPLVYPNTDVFLVIRPQADSSAVLWPPLAAAVIDHWGLFTATQTPITWVRAGGIALMAVGVFVTQKA